MSIHIGSWIFPTLITMATLAWAFWPRREDSFGYDVVGVFFLLAAIIVSLASWLVWSLVA